MIFEKQCSIAVTSRIDMNLVFYQVKKNQLHRENIVQIVTPRV